MGHRVHGQEHRNHADPGAELRLALGDRRCGALHPPRLIAEAHQRGCSLEDLLQVDGLESRLDEHHITGALYTAHMPDPDLVIRTSGEQRISNFLLWQIAYSELFITDRLWPDFRGIHLLEAILDYQHRERRFGGLGESFTDEDLDTLQPAAEVAEEIVTKLTPKQLAPR